jgi:hypothetical protein
MQRGLRASMTTVSLKNQNNTKGVIRNRESKKDIKHNGQMKKNKVTNNDQQRITHKTNNLASRTH